MLVFEVTAAFFYLSEVKIDSATYNAGLNLFTLWLRKSRYSGVVCCDLCF